MVQLRIWSVCAAMLFVSAHSASGSQVYWSSGDPTNGFQSLGFNEISPTLTRQFFEDFDVTDPDGIAVTGLWSHNFMPTGTTGFVSNVQWSIHTLVTPGSGGIEIATGISPVSLTPNG